MHFKQLLKIKNMNKDLSHFDLSQEEINLILDYRDSTDEIREGVAGMLRLSAERNRKKEGYPFAGMSRVSKTLDQTLDGQ